MVNTVAAVAVGLMSLAILSLSVAGPPEARAAGGKDDARVRRGVADSHTFGNIDQVRVQHIDLDLTVDFGK